MEPVAVVVMDGEELSISILLCLTQQRLAHQLGSLLILQEDPALNAGGRICYSAIYPTQGIQYSQVCGRIIGYQVGEPEAFFGSRRSTINERYVDELIESYLWKTTEK